MMSLPSNAEQASLTQLQQTPIDTVLSSIDQGLVHLPAYRELYYRWERQQWSASEIDFISDRIQWEDMTEEEQDRIIFSMAAFFQGEASVTDALAPYVLAMPDEEMRIYVTTQLVDEARHTIFFARFFNEVLGIDEGRLEDTLVLAQEFMKPAAKFILMDSLVNIAERLRQDPTHLATLVEGVTLYHILIEGTMGLAGQRTLLENYRRDNLFPGFRGGFTAVARDESRHVIFGVKFLRDMIQRDGANAEIICKAIATYAPYALSALAPADEMIPTLLAEREDPWVAPRYGRQSLVKKLKVIGLRMDLPEVPPPPTW